MSIAYSGRLIDISWSGALFEARLFHLSVNPGEICYIEFQLTSDDNALAVRGAIVHSRRNLIGIRFEPLDDERREKLRHIGSINPVAPNQLNREIPALFQPWQS
jgi:PilZ domain